MSDFQNYWGDKWGGLFGDYEPRSSRWIGQLLPPGMALDQCTDEMRDLLAGTAEEWDIIFFEASEILRMIDPREMGFLFADWQRITQAEIPHPQLTDLGEQTPGAYLSIAASYGYTDVTFSHVDIWNCESSCEAPLYEEHWNTTIMVMGTSLGTTIDEEFEMQIQARKQLGTRFVFSLV